MNERISYLQEELAFVKEFVTPSEHNGFIVDVKMPIIEKNKCSIIPKLIVFLLWQITSVLTYSHIIEFRVITRVITVITYSW